MSRPRARRHGRGRGAGSHRAAARRARQLHSVHQPQSAGGRAHVRPRGSAVRRRAHRGGAGCRGVRRSAPSLHRRTAALHARLRHAQESRPARDHTRLSAGARHDHRPLRVRGSLRNATERCRVEARRPSTSAAAPRCFYPERAPDLPRQNLAPARRGCAAPNGRRAVASSARRRSSHAQPVEDLSDRRPALQAVHEVTLDLWPGETLGSVGRIRQR
jgi:hypothetical protein